MGGKRDSVVNNFPLQWGQALLNWTQSDSCPQTRNRMKKHLAVLAVLSSLALSNAQTYQANLDGLQEVPPNASPGFGLGDFSLSGTNLSVTTGTYQDLLGGATAVTVNDAAIGFNGSIVFVLTLDTPAAATGTFSGAGALTLAQVSDLNAGNLYVNIRSQVFPSGEIRGQIAVVPEPTSMALLGTGSVALLAVRRKKI